MVCWKCRKEINITEIHRGTECPLCKADLRCCKACRFYSPGSHYDCKETVDDNITDKEKANFCDYFSAKKDFTAGSGGAGGSGSGMDDKAKAAKDAFNALFG